MIFYDCSTAPSPRRARMFIAEKGLDIETREVSMIKGAQLQPDFLAVNPGGTIPVLVLEDGTTLTENTAIATYLEAKFPEPPLMGTTPKEKALVVNWQSIVETQGGMPIAQTFRNSHPAMKDRSVTGPVNYAQIPELAVQARDRAERFFEVLENRLRETPYLAGDRFTLADLTGYVIVDFARVAKLRIPAENTATQDWYSRIAARPSAKL